MSKVWWPIMAAGCVIGVDLGGTKLLAGTVDSKLEVHHRAYRLARLDDTGALIDQLVEAVQEAVEAARGEVLAVGLGIPCLVDPETGVALDSNHLPLRGVAVRDLLAERLGLPVAVDNDANAAMLVEWRSGEARGTQNAIMLTLGTGIGGGLIVHGRLVHGARGAAAELGHIIVDSDGPPCPGRCPNHGCLEALVSGHAIGAEGLRVAREAPDSGLGRALSGGREVTGALVTELAHDGDPAACDVMTLMGRRLGLGLVTLVNIFNPEVVVVGGGAIAAGELLLAPAR
ncbi:MAG: ROK family protein, partial [Solirubrobacteraceae bacterium]